MPLLLAIPLISGLAGLIAGGVTVAKIDHPATAPAEINTSQTLKNIPLWVAIPLAIALLIVLVKLSKKIIK